MLLPTLVFSIPIQFQLRLLGVPFLCTIQILVIGHEYTFRAYRTSSVGFDGPIINTQLSVVKLGTQAAMFRGRLNKTKVRDHGGEPRNPRKSRKAMVKHVASPIRLSYINYTPFGSRTIGLYILSAFASVS